MPVRRRKAINKLAAIHGRRVVNSVLGCNSRVPDNALVTLSNMWHERAAFILSQLAEGKSFTAAEVASRRIYDTCNWGEIASRLARARGNTLGNAARLAHQGTRIVQSDEQRRMLIEQASEIRAAAHSLTRLLARIAPKEVSKMVKSARSSDENPCRQIGPFGHVEGQLVVHRQVRSRSARHFRKDHVPADTGPTGADQYRSGSGLIIESAR